MFLFPDNQDLPSSDWLDSYFWLDRLGLAYFDDNESELESQHDEVFESVDEDDTFNASFFGVLNSSFVDQARNINRVNPTTISSPPLGINTKRSGQHIK